MIDELIDDMRELLHVVTLQAKVIKYSHDALIVTGVESSHACEVYGMRDGVIKAFGHEYSVTRTGNRMTVQFMC